MSAAPQPGCAGFRSPWFDLEPGASLDKDAGRLYARLRTIVVRSDGRRGGHGHGRDRIMVLLDLSGSDPAAWTDPHPAYPGGWTSRLRLPLLLHKALSRATSLMGSRYSDAKLPAGCSLADAPHDAGIPLPESGYTDVLSSLSASPEEVLMRALDFNPVRGVVRLEPGMRLCVTATGARIGIDSNDNLHVRMTFGAPDCQVRSSNGVVDWPGVPMPNGIGLNSSRPSDWNVLAQRVEAWLSSANWADKAGFIQLNMKLFRDTLATARSGAGAQDVENHPVLQLARLRIPLGSLVAADVTAPGYGGARASSRKSR